MVAGSHGEAVMPGRSERLSGAAERDVRIMARRPDVEVSLPAVRGLFVAPVLHCSWCQVQ